MKRTAIIIGAGPAGLTAALELLRQTDIHPIILEESDATGGISRTVNYKGNLIDIGGHRFFSKSDVVMDWWQKIMPVQSAPASDDKALRRDMAPFMNENGKDPEISDSVLLVRHRLSRILYLRKFFDYPISLSKKTFVDLGTVRLVKIGLSYLYALVKPIKPEKTLEDFFTNRFGAELYKMFFEEYTKKVWGVSCDKIDASWGAQRIKGLSIIKTISHALHKLTPHKPSGKLEKTETSLIENFLYPKYGPGQMWESVADKILSLGGEIHMNTKVINITQKSNGIVSITTETLLNNKEEMKADFFLSSMPIRDLITSMNQVPKKVSRVAEGLVYRDFVTVGVLLSKLSITNQTDIPTLNDIIPDHWIYVQENDVNVGRLQIFNNWSPYLAKEQNTVWLGLEYFCNEGDEIWSKNEEEMKAFAIAELMKIGIAETRNVIDSVVIKVPKAYPAYFGTYDAFASVREYVDSFKNLFLIGRNGMHRYNNMDHSMLTAIEAVNNIKNGVTSKENIWRVNTEKEYHENS